MLGRCSTDSGMVNPVGFTNAASKSMAVEGESSKEVPMQFELFEGKWR